MEIKCLIDSCVSCQCFSVCKHSINMMNFASKLQNVINNSVELDDSLPIKDLKVVCKYYYYNPNYITYTPTYPCNPSTFCCEEV